MGVEIVHHQSHLDGVWIAFVEHAFDEVRPIRSRPTLSDLDMPPSTEWLDLDENFRHPVTDIFVNEPCSLTL